VSPSNKQEWTLRNTRQHRSIFSILHWLTLTPSGLLADAVQEPVAEPAGTVTPLGAGYLIQFTLGLIAVLTAVMILAWIMRRMNRWQMSAGGSLRLLGGLSLGARERILLVQVGDIQLLVGVAPGYIRKLHVLTQPLPATKNLLKENQRDSFYSRLANALQKGITHQGPR
jgi:flagellar protein FliO/FliZ